MADTEVIPQSADLQLSGLRKPLSSKNQGKPKCKFIMQELNKTISSAVPATRRFQGSGHFPC